MDRPIETQSLQGTSELTLLAPIKSELVPLLETRSHETRLRMVLATLSTLRKTSREHSLVRPFSDSTDRIRTITDLRMAILEDEHKLLLSVTFDRPWEPYLRIVWRDVGSLLDLIFCNCEGYPISFLHTLAEYGAWIAKSRTNTRFFYRPSGMTYDDAQYLRQTERLQRAVPGAVSPALEAARIVTADPGRQAADIASAHRADAARLGMQAVSVLYRLADSYRSEVDAQILLRASHELLRELRPMTPLLPTPVRTRFAAQLAWFEQAETRQAAQKPPALDPNSAVAGIVQRGILSAYGEVTHGCVVLIAIGAATEAASFLGWMAERISTEPPQPELASGPHPVHTGIAITAEGLRRLGLTEAQLDALPRDFTDGMEKRAGLLGDVRGNHPLHWDLPERNWPQPLIDPQTGRVRKVRMSTVHLVVQMWVQSTDNGHELIDTFSQRIAALAAAHPSLQVLSVQPMRRHVPAGQTRPRDHFGFVDGLSQPLVVAEPPAPAPGRPWHNLVGRGEMLMGYVNDSLDPPRRDPLTDNGSFLVIRKLRQDVVALNDAIGASGIAPDMLKGRLMGRSVDGEPLAGRGQGNAFDHGSDADGARCPLESHVRRANPRTAANARGEPTVPRIMRRGMSYGPRFDAAPGAERGLVFMAYNANIAEQFEVVQRWLTGGNSSGVLSEHADPFLGVPQIGESRSFRFHDGHHVTRVELDAASDKPSRPFVRLEWGAYLFVPSKPGLLELQRIASAVRPAIGAAAEVIQRGRALIKELRDSRSADAWKTALEDSHARTRGDAEEIWASIRADHGGAFDTRTDYGVLVGSHDLVMKVLTDQAFSVCGYPDRLKPSIGMMYLGLDDGGPRSQYRRQSTVTNAAIMKVGEAEAFGAAHRLASAMLRGLVRNTQAMAAAGGEAVWEVTLDIKEISDHTLAGLCDLWFFGPRAQNPHLAPGGWRWDWQDGTPPLYPGHFMAPSRHAFQPRPGLAATEQSHRLGRALNTAMKAFVASRRADPTLPVGTIAKPMFADRQLADPDLLARTVLGVLIGFLPTVEGNFRATLNEWLDGATQRLTLQNGLARWSLWDLQNAYLADARPDAYVKARDHLRKPLLRTMQLRPAPELGWRTAIADSRLGPVRIRAGDKRPIVVSHVSAAHDELLADRTNVCPVFGGDRRSSAPPTHACPGYDIAIGTLLGMLAALLEAGWVRPTPAPLTVGLRGSMAA